jgi:hypothetical protein
MLLLDHSAWISEAKDPSNLNQISFVTSLKQLKGKTTLVHYSKSGHS